MHVIRTNMQDNKRELICQKNMLNLDRIKKESITYKIEELLGEHKKLSVRMTNIN
jgi:hypothetical protein